MPLLHPVEFQSDHSVFVQTTVAAHKASLGAALTNGRAAEAVLCFLASAQKETRCVMVSSPLEADTLQSVSLSTQQKKKKKGQSGQWRCTLALSKLHNYTVTVQIVGCNS